MSTHLEIAADALDALRSARAELAVIWDGKGTGSPAAARRFRILSRALNRLEPAWRVYIGQLDGDWKHHDQTYPTWEEARQVLLGRLRRFETDTCSDCVEHARQAAGRLAALGDRTEFLGEVEGEQYALVLPWRQLDAEPNGLEYLDAYWPHWPKEDTHIASGPGCAGCGCAWPCPIVAGETMTAW